MTKLSLRDAAKEAGTSKTSILRAIQSGRLSAPRNDQGGYEIDPAELFRVYPRRSTDMDHRDRSGTRPTDQSVPADGPHVPGGVDARTAVMTAALEAQIQGLQEIIRRLDGDKADLKADRDAWRAQAESAQRLLSAPPQPSTAIVQSGSRGLLSWFRRAS
jgi:hypothetical protein